MGRYRLTIGDKTFEVEVLGVQGEQARVLVNGRTYEVKYQPLTPGAALAPSAPARVTPPRPAAPARPAPPVSPPPEKPAAAAEPGEVMAPMPGCILDVLVKVGDRVQAGDTVVKLEAMKMENDLQTPIAGVVKEVRVSKGDNVSVGEVLVAVSA
ncbi:MAG: acetyl-CoA carboxylase biotin carboxyl carrier protein subunit [Deltaproteobacteria bacterium]|nr:acetyl-CoA carboxylase biotin carboxyl carrier protein subunit [Deltaproteobacteria bacterium]MBI4796370.1 acetyl-CoA carboxylase biotin carboxyl carrier protein subunit [Deltaproteobacteria bacterium]